MNRITKESSLAVKVRGEGRLLQVSPTAYEGAASIIGAVENVKADLARNGHFGRYTITITDRNNPDFYVQKKVHVWDTGRKAAKK